MTRANRLVAKVQARIASDGGDGWKIAGPEDSSERVRERLVQLSVEGSEREGFHLVMTPEGCFTADYWYSSKEGAPNAAEALFGVRTDAWRRAV